MSDEVRADAQYGGFQFSVCGITFEGFYRPSDNTEGFEMWANQRFLSLVDEDNLTRWPEFETTDVDPSLTPDFEEWGEDDWKNWEENKTSHPLGAMQVMELPAPLQEYIAEGQGGLTALWCAAEAETSNGEFAGWFRVWIGTTD